MMWQHQRPPVIVADDHEVRPLKGHKVWPLKGHKVWPPKDFKRAVVATSDLPRGCLMWLCVRDVGRHVTPRDQKSVV